jgi:hypothetical protein
MSNSHLGQPVGNHVTLFAYGTIQGDSSVTWTFYRMFPNGTAGGFNIPKGKAFVVTDVDWKYNTSEHNRTQTFNIYIKMHGKAPGKEFRQAI